MKTRSVITPLLTLGLALVVFSGCQTAPKINSEFDAEAGFTAAKTFFVCPLPKQIPNVDPGLLMRVGPAALGAARTGMAGRGYAEVTDVAKADLAVVIHGKSVPKTDVTDWGFTPYYGRAGWYGGYAYGGSNITVDQYDEGTLAVEIYDLKTSKMIWVGWVTARRTDKTEEQAARVAEGITKIIAEYPIVGNKPVKPAKK
jgi:hypothetical protein